MASFFEKNKRKSALALLLLFLKWRKGLAPLLLIVLLLLMMSFAPGNLLGIAFAGMSRIPGGAQVAAAVTWSASKVGLEIGGVPHQNSYREYVAAFRLAGEQGFAGLLQKRSFKDLIDAFRAARYDRNAAMNLLFHNSNGAVVPGSGLDMVVKDSINGGGAGPMGAAGKIGSAKSVKGVMTPEEARMAAGEKGVSLDEADLEGERAGMVDSAFASGLGTMNPDDLLGGSGAYASKAFFGAPGAMGGPGAFGPNAVKGANGSNIAKFRNGLTASGGGARLSQTTRRGGQSMYLGRHGTKFSKALGTLRGMVTLNDQIRTGTTMEEAAGSSTEQWEGSPLTGQQAQLPSTPPDLQPSGAGGGFGGIPGNPGGGSTPSGGNINYSAGDPGLICTSAQLAQGMVSDGKTCVAGIGTGVKTDVAQYNDPQVKFKNDLFAALGLFAAAAVLIAVGRMLFNTGSSCLMVIGVALMAAGFAVGVGAIAKTFSAIADASQLMGNGFGTVESLMMMATAVSAAVLGIMAMMAAFALSFAGLSMTVAMYAGIILMIGSLMTMIGGAVGAGSPQTPQVDNPVDDQREKEIQANADDGSSQGLPPPPPDMHYETGADNKPYLAYDYNTFPAGSDVPPNVETELNSQKGGGDSTLPPAPDGQHYEGVNSDGSPHLVPDYVIGVAQRQDSNSFKGGPPTQLPAAPNGQHYELTNQGGDPTDPKSWKLVTDYNIPQSDLQKANANKGQQYSQCASAGPAPTGMHYEGYDCHLVKDYPTN